MCVWMCVRSDRRGGGARLAQSSEVWNMWVHLGSISSPLLVFCKSLSHPKPELLSDDLIDLHESVWGAVKETGSDRETGEHCTITLSKIRRGTLQSHLNNKKRAFFLKGMALLILIVILHTIAASLPSPHCRREIALLIKDCRELICCRRNE